MKALATIIAWLSLATAACAQVPPQIPNPGTVPKKDVITFPIELMSNRSGYTRQIKVVIPNGQASQITKLWVRAHNLSYANKASLKVGAGPWVVLSNSTCDIEYPGNIFGGIGGTYSTLRFTIPVPPGALHDGINYLMARFNFSNGVSSGWRLLGFNFKRANNSSVLDESTFRYTDPNQLKGYTTDPVRLARGKRLYESASLVNSPMHPTTLKVACIDCHTVAGLDLKFYGYTPESMVKRSMFHGLTRTDGEDIASYVWSNSTRCYGRPWNPPFQPGPGIDDSVEKWFAGAGEENVLANDVDTVKEIFPTGISENYQTIRTDGYINVRTTRVALQGLDWNHWLPIKHPKDMWGDEWLSSEALKRYDGSGTNTTYTGKSLRQFFGDTTNLATWLKSPNARAYINTFNLRVYQFLLPKQVAPWTQEKAEAIYSTALWSMVKWWEMTLEFNLANKGQLYYGTITPEKFTFFTNRFFMSSPFMLDMRNGILTGTELGDDFLSNEWYQIQLELNPGNKNSFGTNPIDWGYNWGKFKDFFNNSNRAEGGRFMIHFAKGMQEYNQNGLDLNTGWNLLKVKLDQLVNFAYDDMWDQMPSETRIPLFNAVTGAWLRKCESFTANEWHAQPGCPPATYVPLTTTGSSAYNGNLADRMRFIAWRMGQRGFGVEVRRRFCDCWKRVWPLGDWDALRP